MDKIDFLKETPELYRAKPQPAIIVVPTMRYLLYDGVGSPEGNPAFQKAMQALYGVAYSLKFLPRQRSIPHGYRDFKVPPPEGLWWTASGEVISVAKPADWRWTLMIRVPDFVTRDLVTDVATRLAEKKQDAAYHHVRLGIIDEGRVVQILHVGPL